MSRKVAADGVDRRARRTRDLLAQALIDLGAEHGVDALEVSDITETAGVGRSTFYAHFASKQDFLTRSFVDLIASAERVAAEANPDRPDLLPSRFLFAHVAEARAFAARLPTSSEYPAMMAAGEAKLRIIVEANLARRLPSLPVDRRRETAIYIAGGFMGLLRWWMEAGARQSAEQMQAAFAKLSERALAAD